MMLDNTAYSYATCAPSPELLPFYFSSYCIVPYQKARNRGCPESEGSLSNETAVASLRRALKLPGSALIVPWEQESHCFWSGRFVV